MGSKKIFVSSLVAVLLLNSCGPKKKVEETQAPIRNIQVPSFNADSAFNFVERQVRFGPRVPNTKAHQQAAEYFIERLKKYGASVTTQDFDAVTWDNQKVKLRNIIASYNPNAQKRILLAA